MSDRLEATAKLYDEIAEQLDHVLEAQERLHAQAREHAAVSVPDPS